MDIIFKFKECLFCQDDTVLCIYFDLRLREKHITNVLQLSQAAEEKLTAVKSNLHKKWEGIEKKKEKDDQPGQEQANILEGWTLLGK